MKGLTERERYIAVARMRVNNAGVRNKHFKKEQVLEVLMDIRFWLAFSMAFLMMIANGPVSSFIPIFINEFGYDTLTSLLLTVPCGAVIGTVELVAPYIAYKYPKTRCWTIAVCQLGTVLAALLLWLLPRSSKGGLLFGIYILASFGGSYAVLMGIQTSNTAGYTKKSVTASGLFLAYCLVGHTLSTYLPSACVELTVSRGISLGHCFSRPEMRQRTLQDSSPSSSHPSLLVFWQWSTDTFVFGRTGREIIPALKRSITLTWTI